MASGGLLGTGLGQGRPDLVPFAQSDFIVAALGEELGLTGLDRAARPLRDARRARPAHRDRRPRRVRQAARRRPRVLVALQVFVVVGGVTRLIPLTGLTTPFLAYGGSSLVANWSSSRCCCGSPTARAGPPESVTRAATERGRRRWWRA